MPRLRSERVPTAPVKMSWKVWPRLPRCCASGLSTTFQRLQTEYHDPADPASNAGASDRSLSLMPSICGAKRSSDLFRELLIGVTQFFRDEEAFETLKTNFLPSLLAFGDTDDPIRVWVAGCAIAILLQETIGAHRTDASVTIFGTGHRSASRGVCPCRPLSQDGRYISRTVATLVCERWRGLPSNPRHSRDAASFQNTIWSETRRSQNRSGLLPQRADLHGQRLPAQLCRRFIMRFGLVAICSSGHQRASAANCGCSALPIRSTASSSAATAFEQRFRNSASLA